jgi:hypothetical protein
LITCCSRFTGWITGTLSWSPEKPGIDRTCIEEAAVADACEIELRNRLRRQAQERAERIAVLR